MLEQTETGPVGSRQRRRATRRTPPSADHRHPERPVTDTTTAIPPLDAYPTDDSEVAGFARSLGLPGYLDVHVHALPEKLQQAVWTYFDGLSDPPWPIAYRHDEATRLATLRELGVVAHTALAYAHRPGVAAWCNAHTLDLAERHPQVIPTFTLYPEPGVDDQVAEAIERGGRVAKVHLQVGRFHTTDPLLKPAWAQLAAAGVPAVVHASAVYGVDGGQEYCGPDAIRALLMQQPDVRVIVAHLGMPDPAGFLALADEVPSVCLDTTMTLTDPPYGEPFPDALLGRVRELVMEGRVLFGSDFPTIPHRYAAQVRGLAALGLTVAGLRALLHDNAARLIGLPTAA